MTVAAAREPATPVRPIRWPRWVQMIGRQVRRAIRRRRCRAEARVAMAEWQLRDIGLELQSEHDVRKAFFSAQAQMGMFR